jgi:indole-3-pyruvate monooxygenase
MLPVKQTNTLIVGASISGLASAACLQKQGIDYLIIEQHDQVATPWRNHYDRLHLHTNKRNSNLPYKKFDSTIPRYPSRQQVVNYLEDYQKAFDIQPVFNTRAVAIKKEGDHWLTQTNRGTFSSKYLVMATGPFGKPKPIQFNGMETFPGQLIHSSEYKTGAAFKGQKVLVVGFGNSACEIAIDLVEQGAMPFMAVRSAVNVIPRDVFGLPALELSVFNVLPPRIADAINAPLIKWIVGDITKLGLTRKRYGPLEQIRRERKAPVLDIGTIQLIRKGQIKILGDIDYINGSEVHFKDGNSEAFDAIVACIGYCTDDIEILAVDKSRFEDLRESVSRQQYFGRDGLYFCGYWISPTGQIREIASDAQQIATDIARKEQRG